MKTQYISGTGLTLTEAFEIRPGEIVALVGGGGKTSTLFRLGAEIAATECRAIGATTTHILPPQPDECSSVVLEPTLDRLLLAAERAFATARFITVARGHTADGRLAGIPPEWVVQLQRGLGHPTMLVEADGSKSRPFKAPAAHEPVIPAETTLVIPVVGLSILGAPLTNERVHRPEIVASLAGARLGETVSAEIVAAVLAHAEGGRRTAPPAARFIPLLNQADGEAELAGGREVARALVARGVGRVVIGAVRQASPVREVVVAQDGGARVTAVVLAAGLGRRMGRLKLGLALGGKPLLQHVVDAALASVADEVLAVVGHQADELQALVPAHDRLRMVLNPDYATGQSASIRAAVAALSADTDAVLFLLGDQPTITPAIIDAVVHAFRARRAPAVQPVFRGTPGHPVLFARSLFPELLGVTGDEGGREVLRRHLTDREAVPLDCDAPGDVDTAADYERLLAGFENS